MKKLTKNIWVTSSLIGIVIIGIIIGIIYWIVNSKRIYTDNAVITAPITILTPSVSGILNKVYVNVGDKIPENTIVAEVGNELLKSITNSNVISANDAVGTMISPGQSVVNLINPDELRVVAHIDEDKGLSDIKIGQYVVFTIDTYGFKEFEGIVDEISQSARQGDIVFNISDKRQTNQFDIKIRYDNAKYTELKNGMSARVWIYK